MDDIRKAQVIASFLQDPTIQEAVAGTRALLVDRWARASTVADREQAHATLQGMLEFLATLAGLQNAGDYAKIMLEREMAQLI
jgi:hypothetical protein